MSPTQAILRLDLKGVFRDNVMMANISLSFVGMIVITVVGYYQSDNSAAVAWFPFLIIMALISNPPAYGFLFGLLMVDERDTDVRKALAISPVSPVYFLLLRTVLSTSIMIVWPLITVFVMNSTWQALPVTYLEVFVVGLGLAFMAPVVALCIASYAKNKVEALALFKGLNFLLLLALALEFIPEDAFYRLFFLISPTSWSFMAFDAFADNLPLKGYMWALGGAIYTVVIYTVIVRRYLSDTYKS